MNKQVKFNSKSLLDIKFEKDVKGYNPLQVDETLDEVIKDYKFFEENLTKVDNENAILTKESEILKAKIRSLEIEIGKLKTQLDAIPKNANFNADNITLIKRIDSLERALYKKGVDPKKI